MYILMELEEITHLYHWLHTYLFVRKKENASSSSPRPFIFLFPEPRRAHDLAPLPAETSPPATDLEQNGFY